MIGRWPSATGLYLVACVDTRCPCTPLLLGYSTLSFAQKQLPSIRCAMDNQGIIHFLVLPGITFLGSRIASLTPMDFFPKQQPSEGRICL